MARPPAAARQRLRAVPVRALGRGAARGAVRGGPPRSLPLRPPTTTRSSSARRLRTASRDPGLPTFPPGSLQPRTPSSWSRPSKSRPSKTQPSKARGRDRVSPTSRVGAGGPPAAGDADTRSPRGRDDRRRLGILGVPRDGERSDGRRPSRRFLRRRRAPGASGGRGRLRRCRGPPGGVSAVEPGAGLRAASAAPAAVPRPERAPLPPQKAVALPEPPAPAPPSALPPAPKVPADPMRPVLSGPAVAETLPAEAPPVEPSRPAPRVHGSSPRRRVARPRPERRARRPRAAPGRRPGPPDGPRAGRLRGSGRSASARARASCSVRSSSPPCSSSGAASA